MIIVCNKRREGDVEEYQPEFPHLDVPDFQDIPDPFPPDTGVPIVPPSRGGGGRGGSGSVGGGGGSGSGTVPDSAKNHPGKDLTRNNITNPDTPYPTVEVDTVVYAHYFPATNSQYDYSTPEWREAITRVDEAKGLSNNYVFIANEGYFFKNPPHTFEKMFKGSNNLFNDPDIVKWNDRTFQDGAERTQTRYFDVVGSISEMFADNTRITLDKLTMSMLRCTDVSKAFKGTRGIKAIDLTLSQVETMEEMLFLSKGVVKLSLHLPNSSSDTFYRLLKNIDLAFFTDSKELDIDNLELVLNAPLVKYAIPYKTRHFNGLDRYPKFYETKIDNWITDDKFYTVTETAKEEMTPYLDIEWFKTNKASKSLLRIGFDVDDVERLNDLATNGSVYKLTSLYRNIGSYNVQTYSIKWLEPETQYVKRLIPGRTGEDEEDYEIIPTGVTTKVGNSSINLSEVHDGQIWMSVFEEEPYKNVQSLFYNNFRPQLLGYDYVKKNASLASAYLPNKYYGIKQWEAAQSRNKVPTPDLGDEPELYDIIVDAQITNLNSGVTNRVREKDSLYNKENWTEKTTKNEEQQLDLRSGPITLHVPKYLSYLVWEDKMNEVKLYKTVAGKKGNQGSNPDFWDFIIYSFPPLEIFRQLSYGIIYEYGTEMRKKLESVKKFMQEQEVVFNKASYIPSDEYKTAFIERHGFHGSTMIPLKYYPDSKIREFYRQLIDVLKQTETTTQKKGE